MKKINCILLHATHLLLLQDIPLSKHVSFRKALDPITLSLCLSNVNDFLDLDLAHPHPFRVF